LENFFQKTEGGIFLTHAVYRETHRLGSTACSVSVHCPSVRPVLSIFSKQKVVGISNLVEI